MEVNFVSDGSRDQLLQLSQIMSRVDSRRNYHVTLLIANKIKQSNSKNGGTGGN